MGRRTSCHGLPDFLERILNRLFYRTGAGGRTRTGTGPATRESSYHFGFRRPPFGVRGLDCPLTLAMSALGTACLISTPCPCRGLARDCQLKFSRRSVLLLKSPQGARWSNPRCTTDNIGKRTLPSRSPKCDCTTIWLRASDKESALAQRRAANGSQE